MRGREQEVKTVQANGLRFAYLEEGEGQLVLMVHGFPDTPHSWDHARPLVANAGYRVVAPFTRGYHPTEIPKRDADAHTLAEDVIALIDALSAGKPAIVIGHDWGAFAAYGAAALAPEKVAKLVSVGIPHPLGIRPTFANVWGVRHFLSYKLPGAAGRFAADDFAALPAIVKRWSPTWTVPPGALDPVKEAFSNRASLEAALGYYRAIALTPPAFFKKKIGVPTVVFAGTDDPGVTPKQYRDAKRMFTSDYTVEEMPGGHFMHREHPEIFAEKLLAHL